MSEEENLKAIENGIEKIDAWIHDLNKERISLLMFVLGIIVALFGNIIVNGLWNWGKLNVLQLLIFGGAFVGLVICFGGILGISKRYRKQVDDLDTLVKFGKSFLEERKSNTSDSK